MSNEMKNKEMKTQDLANYVEYNISGWETAREETLAFVSNNKDIFSKYIIDGKMKNGLLWDELFDEMEENGYQF